MIGASEEVRLGKIVFIATPIGNPDDLSPRAEEALRVADVWLVEDSRVSIKIAQRLGFKPAMHLLNEQTTPRQLEKYLEWAKSGQTVVVITDGGSPAISDPGALLCDLAQKGGILVDAIPGPSAVINALVLSGFYAQKFAFLGFLPRKPGSIKSEMNEYADSSLTIVFFESPFRIDATLSAIGEVLIGRRYALCRELTKSYQQVWRGNFPTLPSEDECPRRGEFTIVIEGKRSERK